MQSNLFILILFYPFDCWKFCRKKNSFCYDTTFEALFISCILKLELTQFYFIHLRRDDVNICISSNLDKLEGRHIIKSYFGIPRHA